MRYEVHPSDLRFTQDSIGVKFKAPFDSTRIDDAVDMIISGEWTASTFACICVVEVDGVLFSLDNRRLWVFRKAELSSITVKLKKANFDHPRLQDLTDYPRRMKRMKSEIFFPKVRGKVRQEKWSIPAAVNAEPSILFRLAKEHQLPPPVHKVSGVHHLGGVSRLGVNGATGERGTSTHIIDIGTEEFRAPVVRVNCGTSTQDMKHINTIAEAEGAQKSINEYTSTDTSLRSPWREFIVIHPRHLLSDTVEAPLHSDSYYKSSAVPHLGPVSRKTVDDTTGESGASTQTIDIRTEEVNFKVYHQPIKPATVPAISSKGKESAQNVGIEGPIKMAEIQALEHIADLHSDEQAPPLQHQSVQNDTAVSADLEQGDVQMISTDSTPFLSSSQQWWNSCFGRMIDRTWSFAKEAVQTIWSYFKSKSSIPRW